MRRIVVGGVLLWSSVATSQETTGGIRGRLLLPGGAAAKAARVIATGADLQGSRSSVSLSDGFFQLIALPPGRYTLRITHIGHIPAVIDSIDVRLGRTTDLGHVGLQMSTAQLSEVRIAAPRVTLDRARTTIGATLDSTDLAALPSERDHKALMSTLPHVNTSYHGDPANSAGSTGLENMYFIDGVNVTSPFRAISGTALPKNFVRNVEVRSGGFEAEHARALGAIVNAVTYSGSNDFEMNVFGFVDHDALTARAKVEPTLRTTRSYGYDVGARASGPVVRDRLWFSLAYNPQIQESDRVIDGHGLFVDRRQSDVYAAKLTWQPGSGADVSLSLFGDPTSHTQVANPYGGYTPLNPDPLLRRIETGGSTVSIRASSMIGTSVRLEGAVSTSAMRETERGATSTGRTEPLFLDAVAQTVEGGVERPVEVDQSRVGALAKMTLFVGTHTLMGGFELENNRVFRSMDSRFFVRDDTALFVEWRDSTRGEFRNQTPAVYLQDTWRVTDHLTVSPGLRWSQQRLTGASGGTAQWFPNEWQPRLGVSLDIGRDQDQRVFGSFGRFYQQVPLNLSTLWYADYLFARNEYAVDPRLPGATPTDRLEELTYESDWARSIDGLAVEHHDEVTLGWERLLGGNVRLGARGVYRKLRSSFQMGVGGIANGTILWVLGTPGKGDFDFVPAPKRTYRALEVTADGELGTLAYRASYVLSRNTGNYTGLFGSDVYQASPGVNFGLLEPHQSRNSAGLLPNDRTHVVKLVVIQRLHATTQMGGFFTYQSGTPLNEFGAPGPFGGPTFLVKRGSAGRTPAIFDMNLRVAYEPRRTATRTRVVLDFLHLGNPRQIVRRDQQHFTDVDANGLPSEPNPNFGRALAFQPPALIRLGVEITR